MDQSRTDLGVKTIRSAAVMAATALGSRPVRAIASIVLARLLTPEDFGALAMATILVSLTELVSGLGMDGALVQTKRPPETVAFQAFAVAVSMAALLFGLVLGNAGAWARLLGDASVAPVIAWLSPIVWLNGLAIVPEALLRRELAFGAVSKAVIAAELTETLLGLLLALFGCGVWSLVVARLIGAATRTSVLWLIQPDRPWLCPHWDRTAMSEMLRFGLRTTGSGFLSYFNTNWDDWLVGRILGAGALGLYSKAYTLANQTLAGFSRGIVNTVLFSAFSRMQGDNERLRQAYLQSLSAITLIMTPLCLGVLVVADELVLLLLGQKWSGMTTTLQIFTLMALVRPLAGSTSPVFRALGRPEYNIYAGLVLLAVMAPLNYFLVPRGIVGVAAGVTVAYVAALLFDVYQMQRLLPGITRTMIGAVTPGLVAGAVMLVVVSVARLSAAELLGKSAPWLLLTLLVAVGAATYGAVVMLWRKDLVVEMLRLGRDALGKRFRTEGATVD